MSQAYYQNLGIITIPVVKGTKICKMKWKTIDYKMGKKLVKKGRFDYALRCGECSGIIAVDIDVKDNFDSFQQLMHEHDDLLNITLTQQTPNNGYHLIFKYTDKLKCLGNKTRIGGYIDMRQDNSYIVGAGSKVNDKFYQIIDKTKDISDIPDWLVEHLITSSKKKEKNKEKTNDRKIASVTSRLLKLIYITYPQILVEKLGGILYGVV